MEASFAMACKYTWPIPRDLHVERQNLSMRMGMRRFTRLTNGFSKKFKNHCAALMLWFAFYNFCRVHQTLRITPAMAAGIADHVWSLKEVIPTCDYTTLGSGASFRFTRPN